MKKVFTILFAAALLVAAPAQAQVKFGLKGGLNITEMKLDETIADKSNQAGFFIGPTVKFTLPIVGLGIDASALYDQRSSKMDGTDDAVKIQSIQIPINVRYGVGLGSLASIYAFAGPQFGFNIGDETNPVEVANNAIGSWTLKKSSLSANVGLGVAFLGHFQVSANYNIALGTTGEYKGIDPLQASSTIISTGKDIITGDAKANSWQIAVAYYF